VELFQFMLYVPSKAIIAHQHKQFCFGVLALMKFRAC